MKRHQSKRARQIEDAVDSFRRLTQMELEGESFESNVMRSFDCALDDVTGVWENAMLKAVDEYAELHGCTIEKANTELLSVKWLRK